ncbi:hypothetical protein B0H13DRAFT_2014367 [Mycena leptocephala]|nr:hypothetical protein B0H13DRAFT_2014367 [Mycena leptocephala]
MNMKPLYHTTMYSILGLDEPLRERRRTFIQVTVLALTLSLAIPELGVGGDGVLCFDYAVYAPLDLWDTPFSSTCTSTCTSSCTSHLDMRTRLSANRSLCTHHTPTAVRKRGSSAGSMSPRRRRLCCGGGRGRGVGYSICIRHPNRAPHQATLLHSRARLLPRFGVQRAGWMGEEEGEGEAGMHVEILQALHTPNVHIMLG